ncbi:MAG: NAD(P)-dependent oxidoreductase [Bacteroidales bacterium]|nr:NAD(P)-dependent oxidoreductase [Bacteroidales bacterium]
MLLGKVLMIDTTHPHLEESLGKMGFACHHFPDAVLDDYIRIAPEYTGFIVRSKIPLDAKILPFAKQLKFIGRVGAGMENIDVNLAHSLGITCLNAPEGNRDAVGEQAIGMLLALMNNLMIADPQVRKGIWKREENRGFEIKGKTIALIGYGNTGGAFARKLSGFEARIIAYDKYKKGFSDQFVDEKDMETVYREADILSLHIPLTHETTNLIQETYLKQFSKPIWLINTSRGGVVNTAHLMQAIHQGIVQGACLDVLEYEKFSFEDISQQQLPEAFSELIRSQKVILSPHIAGWTHESNFRMAEVLATKIAGLFNISHY